MSESDGVPPGAKARAAGWTEERRPRNEGEATREAGGPERAAASGRNTASSAKREYGTVLLAGAIGALLVLFAVRQRWAQAVFTMPKPLSPETVNVSGSDLVPLAGALALAALAGLAAVIATRGVARRVAGVLLALFGAGAGAAIMTSVTAATVVSVAASKVASPESAAVSGAAGSTTSGTSGNGALVVTGSTGHAIMTGTPWHVAVLIGALLIFLAGLATALRGTDWPVMSARYDAPGGHQAGASEADEADADGMRRGGGARPADSASMWESLSGGEDPTADNAGTAKAPGAKQSRLATPARGGQKAPHAPWRGNVNVSPMHSEGKLPGGLPEAATAAASIGGATFPI